MVGRKVRAIAFFLPQYHPTPENDAWWGMGFTEWTNVTKAKPLFPGHYQPRLPADLGFYDLRLKETRQAQADLAAEYGIEGFCYYHYWFMGKRLLERPVNEILGSGEPDFPFCLCWANETWSRRWLGEETAILQKQTYSLEDDLNHVRWLLAAFSDPRYITVKGRPLFLIYRPGDLPQPEKTTEIFRNECITHGLPDPYLLGVDAHHPGFDFRSIGFDGTLVFEPQLGALADFMDDGRNASKLLRNYQLGVRSSKLKIYDYGQARQFMMSRQRGFPTVPSIFVGWDNTPRRGDNGVIVINSTPDNFEHGLAELINSLSDDDDHEPLIFINAWNEWAEGNYLEPDRENGHAYLERVRRIVTSSE